MVSSCPTNISFNVECGESSPSRKRKGESDAWRKIKITKNIRDLPNEYEGMTRVCAKCGATIKCIKDEIKGTWVAPRSK